MRIEDDIRKLKHYLASMGGGEIMRTVESIEFSLAETKKKIDELCEENYHLQDARLAAVRDHSPTTRMECGASVDNEMALFHFCDGSKKLYFRRDRFPCFVFTFYCSREKVLFLDKTGEPIRHKEVVRAPKNSMLCFRCQSALTHADKAEDQRLLDLKKKLEEPDQ